MQVDIDLHGCGEGGLADIASAIVCVADRSSMLVPQLEGIT